MPKADDPRWILLTEDGSYSTLGRHCAPDEDDMGRASDALARAGLAGWVAVMSQSAYSPGTPEVIEVRALREPVTEFQVARDRMCSRLNGERKAS